MRSLLLPVGLALGSLALAHQAQAQARFSLGPQVGVAGSFTSYFDYNNYSNGGRAYQTRYLAGLEAGVVGALAVGNHWVAQPALLFSQRGFRIEDDYLATFYHARTSVRLRLNYLSLPVSLAYTFRANGQGLQVFGGPYVSLLLGGSYTFHNAYAGYRLADYTIEGTLPVDGSGAYCSTSNDPASFDPISTYYSRRLDAGFQVGVGYRLGHGLVRAGYSLGLTNQGVGSQIDSGGSAGVYTHAPANYHNQAFQLSFAYLFSSHSGS